MFNIFASSKRQQRKQSIALSVSFGYAKDENDFGLF